MKPILNALLAIALVPQASALAQPPLPQQPVSNLAAAIAEGMPFVIHLHRGENNGTLIGGEMYTGQYNRASNTFTLSGRGLRDDGVVIPLTATYGGADPMAQQVSMWGAMYSFDTIGNLFVGPSGGRLAGKIWLQR